MTALVAKADISGTPSRATANAGFGSLWEFVDERFATGDGTAAEKAATRTALETSRELQPVTASVGSNALTLTLNPTNLEFRSATLGSGTVVTRTVAAAISVVVSSGSTLGTVNAVASRLVVVAIDNAGTVELAVANLAGGVNLDECGVISTTAEGGAGGADSATVAYSTTARTNVAYRVVGFVESTQATAGTWATAPSLIQGCGGQALTSLQSLGFGQTWQTVTRTSGTTYYNTTGRPIALRVRVVGSAATSFVSISINGVALDELALCALPSGTPQYTGEIVIPAWASYVLTDTNVSTRTTRELR